ncbi:sensor histidine kinase [Sphaerimonospora mesophila]|uniref:sensor histidine kinase n=1 Tax=Sphaerimonospora mesophila TaxID=37483 RepID=UPI0006E468C9
MQAIHSLLERKRLSVRGPRPQSLRGYITLLATLLATVLMVPAAVLGTIVTRHALTDAMWTDAREQASITAAAVRSGRLTDPITPQVSGIDLVQVVGPGQRVVASSPRALGLPPLTTVWPSGRDSQEDVEVCSGDRHDCVRLSAIRVGSQVVYAGRPASVTTGPRGFDLLFAAQAAILIALTGWGAWKVAGRILRPVEAIRAELAAINVHDLSTRVPEPPGEDEIAKLARTVNSTLSRIEQAKETTMRALQSQRQFAADASHELRTPLAGLRAQLEEARLHPEQTDVREMAEHALRDVERLQAIISDLLLLARVATSGPAEWRPVDLGELVQDEICQRGGRIQPQLSIEDDVMVKVVPGYVGRLVGNLLDNAQRHARGTIEVSVRKVGLDAELTVNDDGEGVPPGERERVFERFMRLDAARSRDRGGTGLGLAIARDVALSHGGKLRVEDSLLGGARFVLQLPLMAALHRMHANSDNATSCGKGRTRGPGRPHRARP